jgi:putative endonuclease
MVDQGARKRAGADVPQRTLSTSVSKGATGAQAEDRALAHLQQQGMRLVQRNYRVARGPSRRAGEIDLIMRSADGTLVFVEVRARRTVGHGGAAASITWAKQRSLVYAAQHYLARLSSVPRCRFDVVAIDGEQLDWLPAAFTAG